MGVALAIFRALALVLFRLKRDKFGIPFWQYSYRLLNLLSGTLIGLGAVCFFPVLPAEYQVIILSAVVGLTAAALATHAVDNPAFNLFMLPACGLPAIAFVYFDYESHYVLSLLLAFFMLVMIKTGRQTRETLIENFKLTYTLQYRANHDPLVGLFNRGEFERQYMTSTPNSLHSIALIFIDLDNFKKLNDSYGHQKGDQALTEFAEIIRAQTRKDDVSARLGGDEFTILLFVDQIATAKAIALNIIADTQNMGVNAELGDLKIGCSVGLAFTSNNNLPYSKLMSAADNECYRSKRNGKNQLSVTDIDKPTQS